MQADRWVETAGGAAVVANRLGIVRADLALSHSDQSAGYAGRLQYEYRDSRPSNVAGRTVGLSLRHVSSEFMPLGAIEPFNPVEWEGAARYGQRIGLHLRLGLGFDYQFGRDERRDTAGGSHTLQRSLFRGADAGIRLRDEIDGEGIRSQSIFVTFSVRPGAGQEVSVYRDTATGSTRSDWRYVPDRMLGSISARVEAEREPAAQRVNGEVEYAGWRGTAAIAAGNVEGRGDGGAGDTRTLTIRGSTAVVYADGAAAIGRPVTQAFAVFVPHPSLAGYSIGVNPVGEGEYQARIDGLGPAVLPEVTPYWHTAARLDTRELPIGLAAGPSVFDIVAGYDRGTKVVVGTGATVFLLATIEHVDGSPVSLQAARVVAEDDPAFAPMLTFTNRVGRVALEGLRPGRYRIEILAAPQAPLQFIVPTNAVGQIDIGPLVLAAEGAR